MNKRTQLKIEIHKIKNTLIFRRFSNLPYNPPPKMTEKSVSEVSTRLDHFSPFMG